MRAARPIPLAALAALASCAVVGSALAQDAATEARAEGLFKDAQRAFDAHDLASACPKFEEAQRLVRGIGVTLYLADCYEQTGRTASAWSQFQLAESLAHAKGDPRESVAHKRAAALEPHLARLAVSVAAAGADVPGLAVTLDTQPVGRPEWGVALPVDPGKHAVHAVAPGKVDWDGQADVAAEGNVRIEVPPLADGSSPPASASASQGQVAPPASTAAPSTSAPSSAPASSSAPAASPGVPTLAWVGFGVGAAGIVVGSVTGAIALGKASAVKGECNTAALTCPPGNGDLSTGQTMGNVSTVAFVIGGVGVAAGVVALFVLRAAPQAAPSTGAHVEPWVGVGSLGVRGAF
jgi:hypothetical protein